MSKYNLSRRHLLRGAIQGSSVAVALPVLDVMLNNNGTAYANGQQLPRRMITWLFGNGVARKNVDNLGAGNRFTPLSTGANYKVGPNQQPFVDRGVKDYCSVLSGFDIAAAGPRGHHGGVSGMFSGFPYIRLGSGGSFASTFGGPSIDQVAAARVAGQTLFPSIEMQITRFVSKGEGPTLRYLSHKGPNEQPEPYLDPKKLWDKLFSNFTTPGGESNGTNVVGKQRRSYLDAVMGDVKDLKKRVSTADRLRIDAHLQNITELQRRIDAVAPTCEKPTRPSVDVGGRSESLKQIHEAMADITAFAFACDLTRVASVLFTGSVGRAKFTDLGYNSEYHLLSHWQRYGGDSRRCNDEIHACTTFAMDQFAYLLAALKKIPEGAGNILDQTVALASSDLADGYGHRNFDMPIVVAGGGGGALKTPSVHYRSPNRESSSNVLMSMLKAFDPTATEVGGGKGRSTTPVSAIMA